MEKLCPTCGGKGLINDPKINGPICYSGPNGETCPQVICISCGGTGWITHYCSCSYCKENNLNQQITIDNNR